MHTAGWKQSNLILTSSPRLKAAMKGRRPCDAANIVKNATEELKRLPQNGFQE